jgi:hypothetical protein
MRLKKREAIEITASRKYHTLHYTSQQLTVQSRNSPTHRHTHTPHHIPKPVHNSRPSTVPSAPQQRKQTSNIHTSLSEAPIEGSSIRCILIRTTRVNRATQISHLGHHRGQEGTRRSTEGIKCRATATIRQAAGVHVSTGDDLADFVGGAGTAGGWVGLAGNEAGEGFLELPLRGMAFVGS